MEQLPTLYKLTNTGAIQQWSVHVSKTNEGFGLVVTKFGQKGGKIQETPDIIKEGKNIGKKNATDAFTQAQAQAKQTWDKKLKSGYVLDINQAAAGEDDLPSIDPMLAHSFELDEKDKTKVVEGKHMKFPCLGQPKFDGLRAICIVKEGKAKFYSRKRKEFKTLPHLQGSIEFLCKHNGITDAIFDGELYNHEFKDDFNAITSIIKRDELHEDFNKIFYYIYDLPSSANVPFEDRNAMLRSYFQGTDTVKLAVGVRYLQLVETITIKNIPMLRQEFDRWIDDGYEGAMLRDPHSYYENKRSKGLLKFKEMQDAEFKIVGVQEGKGKLMGHAGSFVCEMENGKIFNAKLKGELKDLKEKFTNFDKKYSGKQLTVQFFNLTPLKKDGTGGVPRFPVALRIREDD